MMLHDLLQLALIPSLISSEYFNESNTTVRNSTKANFTSIDVVILSDDLFKGSESSSGSDKGENNRRTSINLKTDEKPYDAIIIASSVENSQSVGQPLLPLASAQATNENELISSRSSFGKLGLQKPKDLGPGLIQLTRWLSPSFNQPIQDKLSSTPSTPKVKNVIIFEENEVLQCNGNQTEYNGKCYDVLKPLPCNPGQWLVEDEATKKGKCVKNECAGIPDTAYFNDKCIKVRSEEPCGEESGMKTYIYKSGQVECDCKEGFLYHSGDKRCYEAYRKGPCKEFQYFAIPKIGKGQLRFGLPTPTPRCIENPCLVDGFVCNAAETCFSKKKKYQTVSPGTISKKCTQLGFPCTGEGTGILIINPETNSPFCLKDIRELYQPDRIIGNVPTLKCAPGSRRDILGNCRTPTIIDFS